MLHHRPGRAGTRWLRFASIAFLVLSFTIAGSRSLLAQQESLTVKIDGFNAADWSRAQTVVTVLDGAGRPVSGLTKDSFAAQLNDTAISPVGLSQGIDSSVPLSVVLTLDASAAMQGDALDQAKLAAHGFLDELGPQDAVAVLAFGDTVSLVQPFTEDHAAAHQAVDGISASGGALLYQATLQSVLQASARADTGRRAVVLLSSGASAAGESSEQEALFAAQALGVPVFDIGLGNVINREYLRQLAQVSGGQFAETPAAAGLVQLYHDVGELLRDQYVLTLDASKVTLDKSEPATLTITATAGERSGSGQRAVCPQGLCVRLRDVSPGDRLVEARTISVEVLSTEPVTSVAFYVDGKKTATVTEPPYQFTLDPQQLAGGEHALSAEVTSGSASARSSDVRVLFGGGRGGFGMSLIAMGAAVLLGVIALLLVVFFIRRPRGGTAGPRPAKPPDEPKVERAGKPRPRLRLLEEGERPAPPAVAQSAPLGRLHVVSGPLEGQTFAIGTAPVSIGSGYRCLIRLPEDLERGEIPAEFARFWVRGDQLMVHELRRLSAIGPTGGRWEMLEDGDVVSIGPCSLRFELGAEAPAEPEEPPGPVPDVLRSADAPPDEAAPSSEPVVDILKKRPASDPAFESEHSTQDGPPQAAAAP